MRTSTSAHSRFHSVSLSVALVIMGLVAVLIPAATAVAQEAEEVEADAQLTWAYNRYAHHGVFGPWRQWTEGSDVAVTMADGEDVSGIAGEAGLTYLIGNFDGGAGTIDPVTGEGTITWETGEWVLNAYPEQYGAPNETYSSPTLTIGPDGTGELTMEVFIPGHDDFLHGGWVDPVGPERKAIATFSSVEVTEETISVVPDFEGRAYDPGDDARAWQECDGVGGSWPGEFIDFLPASVRAHYYTTSCSGLNLLKPPLPFTVSWAETAPEIVRQPVAPTEALEEGRPLNMEVWVSGTPTPDVQWQRSADGDTWTDVDGGVGARYPLLTTYQDAGSQFRAVVSNPHGSVVSEATEPVEVVGEPASILAQPQSATFGRGDDAFVRVWVAGAPWPTVTWERSDDDGATWQDAGGEVTVTTQGTTQEHRLTIASVTEDDDGARFRAQVTNGYEDPSPLVSDEAVLTVVYEAPEVTLDPEDALVYVGQTALLRGGGDGLPAPTFQWEASTDGGTTWTDWVVADDDPRVAGTDRYLEIVDADASLDGHLLRLRLDNGAGVAHSEPAQLTVATPTGSGPEVTVVTDGPIDAAEESRVLVAGTGFGSSDDHVRVVMTDAATWQPGESTRSCQPGSILSSTFDVTDGGFQKAWTVDADEFEMSKQWGVATCRIDDEDHSADTWTPLQFIDLAPSVVNHPQDIAVGRGETVTFSVSVSGSPWPTIQWQRSDDQGGTWSDLDGATGEAYAIDAAVDADSGAWFRVAVSNGVGNQPVIFSEPAILTVSFEPPSIVEQPTDRTALAGHNVNFTPVVTGLPEPILQWETSNDGGDTWTDVEGNAGSIMTLSLTPEMSDDGNLYRLRASNETGEVVTNQVTITVVEAADVPSLTVVPDGPIDPESETTLQVLASGFATEGFGGPILRVAVVDTETWRPGQEAITEGWVASYGVPGLLLSVREGRDVRDITIPAGSLDPTKEYGVAAFSEAPGDREWDTWVPLEVSDSPGSGDQTITVDVPEPQDGEFVWSIDGTDMTVVMGEAVNSGDHWSATGDIHPVVVSDTRPGGAPWSISGQVSDFTGDVPGSYLGWSPVVVASGAGAVAGDLVEPGFPTGDGLSVASTLAAAEAGHEPGTATIGADLDLRLPIDTEPGTYSAILTLTALS